MAGQRARAAEPHPARDADRRRRRHPAAAPRHPAAERARPRTSRSRAAAPTPSGGLPTLAGAARRGAGRARRRRSRARAHRRGAAQGRRRGVEGGRRAGPVAARRSTGGWSGSASCSSAARRSEAVIPIRTRLHAGRRARDGRRARSSGGCCGSALAASLRRSLGGVALAAVAVCRRCSRAAASPIRPPRSCRRSPTACSASRSATSACAWRRTRDDESGRAGAPLQQAGRRAAHRAQRPLPARDPARHGAARRADGDRPVQRGAARRLRQRRRARAVRRRAQAGRRGLRRVLAAAPAASARRSSGDRRHLQRRTPTGPVERRAGGRAARRYHLARRYFQLNMQPHILYILKPLTREILRQEVDDWKRTIRVISHELNNSLAPIPSLVHSARLMLQKPELVHAHRRGASTPSRSAAPTCAGSSRATRGSRGCRCPPSRRAAGHPLVEGLRAALPVPGRGPAARAPGHVRRRRRCSRC